MKKTLVLLSGLLIVAFSCAFDRVTLTVMTYDSFAVSTDLVESFEEENNVDIQFLQGGNGGELIARSILTSDSPVADVVVGFDATQMQKALDYDIFEPYESPLLEKIPDEYEIDPEHHIFPFNFGDVCLNYDANWFESNNLAVPSSFEDLADEAYKGLLVVENPVSSNPGAAFFLATVAAYGEDGFINFWKRLIENDTEIVEDWSTGYYTNFSGSSGMGPQPLVVSYTSSPAAEMIYADPVPETAPTGSVTADGMCYRQVEFAGIMKNSGQTVLAEKFIDSLLGKEWQEDLPMQMFVYPVNEEAALPEAFSAYGSPAKNPVQMDAALVTEKRDQWIQEWSDEVLSVY